MGESIAVVGSRVGADLEHVREFVRQLHAKQPDSLLVSGGANGVDKTAESEWIALGGRVLSLRPKQISYDHFVIERWDLGGPSPRVWTNANDLTFANYASACLYRDMLIAEAADKMAAFYRRGRSRGTAFTVEIMREAYGRPAYEYEAA